MKRTPLKRYTQLKTYTPLKVKTALNFYGKSETAEQKREIQRLLREIVIKRDKHCIRCGVEYGTPGVVFQCDHLLSRSNSATYADSRLCVLVCRECHAWKSLGSNLRKTQYDALVKTILPPERVALWERCEMDSYNPTRKGAYDWKLATLALNHELAAYA